MGFKCPECGDGRLIEILHNVIISTECGLTDDSTPVLLRGDQTIEEEQVYRFQCGKGHPVKNNFGEFITDEDDLIEMFTTMLTPDDVVNMVVDEIADKLSNMSPEELVKEYNRAFPDDNLKPRGEGFVREGE